MNREEYKRYQWIASVCIAFFIVSFAVCLTAHNRSVYRRTMTDVRAENAVTISKTEANLYYEQIADSFDSFFSGGYKIAGYTLSDTNIRQLNRLKAYYRTAWILSVLSLAGMIMSFRHLRRRRETRPCCYGAALGALLAALGTLRIATSKKAVYRGLSAMIFRDDYSYFAEGDLLRILIPENFARNLALLYLAFVLALILVFVLIRAGIRFADRPHRF